MRFFPDESWLVFMTVCIALFTSAALGYGSACSHASMKTATVTRTSPLCATDCFALLALRANATAEGWRAK